MLIGGAGDGIANIYNTKMTVGEYYNNVIRNPYDAKALKRVRDMTETERIYAKAGANAEEISVAAGRAAGHEYDWRKELEAYAYGLRQRKTGKGKEVELLVEATDYLDRKLTKKAKITRKAKIILDFCNCIGYNVNCKVKCGRFKLETKS